MPRTALVAAFPFALAAALLLAALAARRLLPGPTSGAPAATAAPPHDAAPLALPAAAVGAAGNDAALPQADRTEVATGVPTQIAMPCLLGRTPVAVLADGTQVYDDVPYKVRQVDGSMKELRCRMHIQPAPVMPVLPSDPAAAR